LVGAGIGLAFAPKSGDELRNELGDKVRRRAQELQQQNEGAFGGSNRSQMPVT
jgi:gas vesicle protein